LLDLDAEVAERQTHQLEGLAGATPWRFESSLPHQPLIAKKDAVFAEGKSFRPDTTAGPRFSFLIEAHQPDVAVYRAVHEETTVNRLPPA
jgi:hypothetical protein